MTKITTNQIQINYSDSAGEGFPVILIHGWPADQSSWDKVAQKLIGAGYRVITYDRRGYGDSDKPDDGYDYENFTTDLYGIVDALGLEKVALAGFSMGGGEVARFASRHHDRIAAAIYIAAITPALNIEDQDNLAGAMTPAAAVEMQEGLKADPKGFLKDFLTNFYSITQGETKRLMVDQSVIDEAIAVAEKAKLAALSQSIASWLTDFRADIAGSQLPTLVIHGLGDQIVPFDASGARMSQYVPTAETVTVGDGPHGLLASHPDVIADEMISFLDRSL